MAESRASIGARRNPQTESSILDAAAQIAAERGIGKFSIEAVARRARAEKARIHRWWPTRGALLMAVYECQRPPSRRNPVRPLTKRSNVPAGGSDFDTKSGRISTRNPRSA